MTKYRKEKTGVDRFSLRQAVIFICATNRPDELDLEFVRSGRIDRRLYIGLPDAKQRVQIFGVHSAGKQLAEDVDFGKVSDWKSTLIRLAIQSLTVLQLETQHNHERTR
ncbi:ATP-dependent zinc metalloprotease FTSH 12, chloroplastic [Vitis vinifera]|uniref:ATP-dependent zinc metalloprotease FTSH 12, chloroplastic n=1 Tax=Vitis vinifera TaxID=29760 RepID=A0A438CR07_VITVI|nr:ATP-dependent zinc metalloprotease FTSH 12, chloroplastic [Vitis vinifera]